MVQFSYRHAVQFFVGSTILRLAAIYSAAFLVVVSIATVHASEESAVKTVESVNVSLVSMLQDYDTAPGNESARKIGLTDDLETIFRNNLDSQSISRTVLGVAWRRASEEQRGEFADVFVRYLAQKYAKHFPRLVGAQFVVVDSEEIKEYHYLVSVEARHPDYITDISWYVFQTSNSGGIVNIALLGMNILNVERRVIRSLLQQRNGDIDRLTKYLPTRHES